MKVCREFGVNQWVSLRKVALGHQAIEVDLVVDERLFWVFLTPLVLIVDEAAVECDLVNRESFQVLRHRLFVQMYHPFFGWPVNNASWYVNYLLIGRLRCVTTFWGWENDFVLEIQCHIYNYNMEKSVGSKIKKTPAFHPQLKTNEILISRKKPQLVYMKRVHELFFEKGQSEVYIQAIGAAVQQAVDLALQV
jgi:hypothetical protein